MDFVDDALADGRQFRVLTVLDQWSRESPILEVASSMSGHTVSAALERALAETEKPRSITVDHGTDFMSRALEDWAFARGVQVDFIRPANPWRMPSSRPSTGVSATSIDSLATAYAFRKNLGSL